MAEKRKEIKCVVWDLDETIWCGTLLESDKVLLKPNIKEIIQTLDSRGILHSISSKNNFDDAMAKLKKFGLDEYFLYPEIGWNAKSVAIGRIQNNLNFGMDTILFVDDQQFERDEVWNVHPEVMCVDAGEYLNFIDAPYLNPRFITTDSVKRRQMYLADITRNNLEESFGGPSEAFLASLDMKFQISEAKEDDLKRAEELTVRTNQLNATGITYGYDELTRFRQSDQHKLFVCELKDRYGDYGKIGLALVEINKESWYLKLMLMSCRVMSRGVGTVLMSYLMEEAKKSGKKMLADFRKTERNRMMHVSYKFSNFKEIRSDDEGNIVFENDLSTIQEFPSYIDIIIN